MTPSEDLKESVDQNTAIKEAMFQELISETFNGRQVTVMDGSSEPLDMRIIAKIDPKMEVFLCIGQKKFPLTSAQVVAYRKISERSTISYSAIRFQFKGTFLILNLPHGDSYRAFIFYEPTSPFIEMLKQVRRIFKAMNRHEPSIKVMGGGDVTFKEIKKLPYVPPSEVIKVWNQRIDPQLQSGKVYNHVIFFGPPGSGKTAFCRWMALRYPKYKFIFMPPHIASEGGNISRAFRDARWAGKAVLVFEDIDLVGHTRSQLSEHFSPLLGELLTQVDGVEPRENVLAIASTNNISALDHAVVRNGRFGIHMDLRYTSQEKLDIIYKYYPALPLPRDEVEPYLHKVHSPVDLKMIAKFTEVMAEGDKIVMTPEKFGEVVKQISEDKVAKYVKTGKTESNDEDREDDDRPTIGLMFS